MLIEKARKQINGNSEAQKAFDKIEEWWGLIDKNMSNIACLINAFETLRIFFPKSGPISVYVNLAEERLYEEVIA